MPKCVHFLGRTLYDGNCGTAIRGTYTARALATAAADAAAPAFGIVKCDARIPALCGSCGAGADS